LSASFASLLIVNVDELLVVFVELVLFEVVVELFLSFPSELVLFEVVVELFLLFSSEVLISSLLKLFLFFSSSLEILCYGEIIIIIIKLIINLLIN